MTAIQDLKYLEETLTLSKEKISEERLQCSLDIINDIRETYKALLSPVLDKSGEVEYHGFMNNKKRVNYHLLNYGDRYIGVAWADDGTAFISTKDHMSYTDARNELGKTADEMNLDLYWFQGERKFDSETGYFDR